VVNRPTPEGEAYPSASPWKPVVLSNGKRELTLDRPWCNASGTLGFSAEAEFFIAGGQLGAFITNPISFSRRDPAGGPRFMAAAGGFVLHTGLPNPGLRSIIHRHLQRWRTMACPVVPHLIARDPSEIGRMADLLESIEAIAGVEIGLEDEDPSSIGRLVGEAAGGELPVLARLPFGAGAIQAWAALEAGAVGISFGPPRAALPTPGGPPFRGRLYGPAVFAMALERVKRIREAGFEAPVLASGGIYCREDLEAMLAAGASAVQLDSVLWTEPEVIFDEVLGG
jgi:dihydroorotate dehydrogenase (NAD+) catalytic subunit